MVVLVLQEGTMQKKHIDMVKKSLFNRRQPGTIVNSKDGSVIIRKIR